MLNLLPKDILIILIQTLEKDLTNEKIERKLSKLEVKKKCYDIANFANKNTEFNFFVCHHSDCQKSNAFESILKNENYYTDVCKTCQASYCPDHILTCMKDNECIECPKKLQKIDEEVKDYLQEIVLYDYSKEKLIDLFINLEEKLNYIYREGIKNYKLYKKYETLMYHFSLNNNFYIDFCDYPNCDAFEIIKTYYNKTRIKAKYSENFEYYSETFCEEHLK